MDTKEKLIQFLNSYELNDIYLGIELLKSTRDAKLIGELLEKCNFITGFQLVQFFQENPEIFEKVKPELRNHKLHEIMKYMPHRILFLEDRTKQGFCDYVNLVSKEYFNDFPLVGLDILTEEKTYQPVGFESKGEKIVDKTGWQLSFNSHADGPVEQVRVEIWCAVAWRGDQFLRFKYYESSYIPHEMWMEKNF